MPMAEVLAEDHEEVESSAISDDEGTDKESISQDGQANDNARLETPCLFEIDTSNRPSPMTDWVSKLTNEAAMALDEDKPNYDDLSGTAEQLRSIITGRSP